MKINNSIANTSKKRKPNKSFFIILLFLFLLLIYLGNFFASNTVKKAGYHSLWEFVKTISSNYLKSRNANPEKISIEIKNKDFKFLEKNRNQALERNLIVNNIDGDYVPATLEYKGKKLKIKLRLKGHMTDHLQDNKWSFRIKVKDKDSFMGMRLFSIQHPGTRGYIYEWIYHELMKQEDIIALRYKFIDVSVNGRDWGIYAVEENFDTELIENNNRKAGPIIRFNPDLYWVDRYNELIQTKPVAEYASYSSANAEAYREDKILSDSIQRNYYLKALSLIEGLREKKLSVEQVFDIDKLAKFHAIIDLVGGENSIDWSDIKYYYNPVSAKLEPVAYESFTSFDLRKISANYKFVNLDSSKENYIDWHTALFSNINFFKKYISELKRIIKPSYLDKFFSSANISLTKNLKIIYKEFPFKKFDKDGYYRNQKIIDKILNPPKALHSYLYNYSEKKIILQIGNIESLPILVNSVSVGEKIGSSAYPIILPAKQNNQFINYKTFEFNMPSDFIWNDSLIKSMKLNYSILGSSSIIESTIFPFPHTDDEFISEDLKNKKDNIHDFSFLTIFEKQKNIFVKPGKQSITSDLIIPQGYKFILDSHCSLDIKNNAKIISYSPIVAVGSEDSPILITSSDLTSQGIEIIGTKEKSIFNNVFFSKFAKIYDTQWKRSGAITFYESSVDFTNCNFENCNAEDAVNLIRTAFSFKNCFFRKMHDDAIDADFSEGTISNCAFENCDENALDITKSNLKINAIYVNGSHNKALNIKSGTQIQGEDIKIRNSYIAISTEDFSIVNFKNVSISDSDIGLVAYKNKPGGGHPSVKISEISFTNLNKNILKERKSSISINGKEIEEEMNDVETIIRSDKKKHK